MCRAHGRVARIPRVSLGLRSSCRNELILRADSRIWRSLLSRISEMFFGVHAIAQKELDVPLIVQTQLRSLLSCMSSTLLIFEKC